MQPRSEGVREVPRPPHDLESAGHTGRPGLCTLHLQLSSAEPSAKNSGLVRLPVGEGSAPASSLLLTPHPLALALLILRRLLYSINVWCHYGYPFYSVYI